MLELGLEAVPIHQRLLQGCEKAPIAFNGPAAMKTDQMVMVPLLIMVVYGLIVRAAPVNTSRLFEDVQRPVHRGLVDTWHLRLNMLDDHSGSEMTLGMDDVGNQKPLRSEFQSFITKRRNATHCPCIRLQL
jgi:hypothetical protein